MLIKATQAFGGKGGIISTSKVPYGIVFVFTRIRQIKSEI